MKELDLSERRKKPLLDSTAKLITAARKLADLERTLLPQALLKIALPQMELRSGQEVVYRALRVLLMNRELTSIEAIFVLTNIKRIDWMHAWFPETIQGHWRIAEEALAAKKSAHNHQALLDVLADRHKKLKNAGNQEDYWKAVVLLFERRTLSREEAHAILVDSGFVVEAEKYLPVESARLSSGQAGGDIDDGWRYD